MQQIKQMTIEEQKIINDNMIGAHNFIVVKHPETGEVLQVRKNLVVRSGREFDLRKLFGTPYSGETVAQLNSRIVSTFSIGSGGTPIATPFLPLVPTSADIDLNSKVPFRISNTSNPLTVAEQLIYTDPVVQGSDTLWYKKTFTNQSIVINTTTDEVYNKLSLTISELDARNSLISELGLYSAIVSGTNTYSAFKLFSRVTFQTEPLSDVNGKGLDIDYYVYS